MLGIARLIGVCDIVCESISAVHSVSAGLPMGSPMACAACSKCRGRAKRMVRLRAKVARDTKKKMGEKIHAAEYSPP